MFETPKNYNNIYTHIHIQISDQDNNARVFQPLIVASQDSMQTSAYAQSMYHRPDALSAISSYEVQTILIEIKTCQCLKKSFLNVTFGE